MTEFQKPIYTAKVHTVGGRSGTSSSDDGRLQLAFSVPGGPGNGTNPEQLFAAGWSACFLGAMQLAASKQKVAFPADAANDAEVDLCLIDGAYFLQARHKISLPGLPADVAQAVIEAAEQICPYSKATRGNIAVSYALV